METAWTYTKDSGVHESHAAPEAGEMPPRVVRGAACRVTLKNHL